MSTSEETLESTPDPSYPSTLSAETASEDSNSSHLFGNLLPPNQFSFHRIYIFDLDDTIFPTSILSKCVNIWDHTDQSTIDTIQQCHTLYHAIKNCIDYMLDLQQSFHVKYGKANVSMVIVTNASSEWCTEIKHDHSVLIGELFTKLQTAIPLISAKDAFQQKYDDWYSEYSISAKVDAFTQYIRNIDLQHKIPVVYCVGDGSCEFYGIKEACSILWEDGADEYDEESQSDVQNISVNVAEAEQHKPHQAEEQDDALYILHRLKLETNRKKKNKQFDALGTFEKVLQSTRQFLFHDDKELTEVLEREEEVKSSLNDGDTSKEDKDDDDEDDEEEEEDDEEDEWHIIDYIL